MTQAQEGFTKKYSSMKSQDEPRFIADSMLGSLARKLRIIGYDTLYVREEEDNEIINKAMRQRRIILTSDKRLYEGAVAKNVLCFLIKGKTDTQRIREVSSLLAANSLNVSTDDTRCAVCNSTLTAAGSEIVASYVPERIASRHREFYYCKKCGKVYWKGKHWVRLRHLIREFRKGASIANSRARNKDS